jgi:hypothetical protein
MFLPCTLQLIPTSNSARSRMARRRMLMSLTERVV